jgi:hypothetical protein
MSTTGSEPMILVKKPDGTSVRVPLSSLQRVGKGDQAQENEMDTATVVQSSVNSVVPANTPIVPDKEEQKMLPPEPPQILLEESYEDDEQSSVMSELGAVVDDIPTEMVQDLSPVVQQDGEMDQVVKQDMRQSVDSMDGTEHTTVLPDKEIAQPEIVVPRAQDTGRPTSQWSADDHTSPLTETLDTDIPHEVSAIRGESQVVEFLSTVSVAIRPELRGRTIALLSSFLKGVRSRQQIMEYAVKPVETGGLQLSDVEARSLVQQVEEYFRLRPTAVVRPPSPTSISKPTVDVSTASTRSSVDALKPLYARAGEGDARPRMSDIIPPPVTPLQESRTIATTEMTSVLSATGAESIGPVEEIQTFTKDDFRRLNADPLQAANTLLLQMQHVSEESPMLGLSVRRAWFLSPLYREYLSVLENSLQNSFSVAEIAQDGSMLTLDEVRALLIINRACEEV